jgi:hypothetical protein
MVLRLAGGALVGGGVARPDPDNGAGAGPKLARFASSVLREGSGP